MQAGAKCLLQPIVEISRRRLLSRVHQPQSSILAIGRKIRFMRNQQSSWPVADVLIVRHVDQQMLGNRLLLNPRMENRHELFAADAGGIFDKKFDDDLVSFHRRAG